MTSPHSALRALAARSVAVIAEHQDVGGAYPASPTFTVYQFSWFRDGAFIADAMSRTGEPSSADAFFDWCARIINERRSQIETLIERHRAGEPVGRDDHLPTRYTLDGAPTGEDWWDFQLDGYGTWMFMVVEHLTRHQRSVESCSPELRSAIDLCSDYLCEFWSEPCFDWWEEDVDGVHVSTLVSIEAGLRAVAAGGLVVADRRARCRTTAASIVEHVVEFGTIDGHLIKTVGRGDRVDASLIAAFVPFGTFDPRGELATRTYEKIVGDIAPDGVHRYLGDTYFGGGRWVVLAGFVGAFEAVTGRTSEAIRRLTWMCDQQTGDGLLPEQTIDDVLDDRFVEEWIERWGFVATPLLWSHAMYLTLVDEIGPDLP
ncbi:glycoside hydrolase family 15 protein [Ilumatobacter coccineus]|uniref:Putative glycosidase n=1 Tax=Ilumatobacter coccineus (strain NBRC 103263 / KCTC 29153 / YM16-304) TaxID=1313172 RepID=A0A6C7EE89_ILUCY|nr:glycoside hydrolase family 15 protein [Ilumatobacter coccineus]BAN03479.1 putative glycosidase [Ilumatobacter coccineus YM16-304]